ncbi:MAG: hypothetical protein RJA02_1904, partial [Armatimonadota bacterium]
SPVCDGGLCEQIRHKLGGVDYDCRCGDSVDYVGHLHIHLSNPVLENTYL